MLCDLTRVLFIPQQGYQEPWLSDLHRALGPIAELDTLDPGAALDGRFDGVDVVVDQGGHGTKEMIDAAASAGVQLWQVLGTGLDHTEVGRIVASGMRLANTPGQFSATALAEHALLLMLSLVRRLRAAERNARAGDFYAPMVDELGGKVLGLVGLGASGRELARRARALDMTVIAVESEPVDQAVAESFGVEWCGGAEELPRLLGEADIVSLHVPLTSTTRHLIDRERLAMMKPSATIINVARGEIIDEEALVEALCSGRLNGAGLDVFAREPLDPANPLLHLDNVVATPHIAGMTFDTSRRRTEACAENVRRVSDGRPLLHLVEAES
jgi:phosphoglycerate dehydrogenase-like enzyme